METLVIPTNPIPWKRPACKGKRYYDSQVNQKETFRWYAKLAHKSVLRGPEAICLYVEYLMPTPASWSNTKRLQAIGEPHTQTPDIDNLFKFILDAFNGVLWEDDRYISTIYGRKVWSEQGGVILHYGPDQSFSLPDFLSRDEHCDQSSES